MRHRIAIVWLRRDLRLTDNPAVLLACTQAEQVVLIYIHAEEEDAPWIIGGASRWWLHHSLHALANAVQKRGNALILRRGASLECLQDLIRETGASLIVWNRLYEPAAIARDTQIKATLQSSQVEVHSCNGALLFEPWEIKTQAAQPYKVFTPFWRACLQQLAALPPPQAAPKKIPATPTRVRTETLPSLQLLPKIPWDTGLAERWQAGEEGAEVALNKFIVNGCDRYAVNRDYPSLDTSQLSPHLHFGEIGPRQILAALHVHAMHVIGCEAFIRELGWREFAHHVLYYFRQTPTKPFDTRFDNYPWVENAAQLKAWQQGLTGFPIVDAGMRELWRTGFMHNRVRMLAASLLTKNLRIHWLAGARWFWDALVDADLANNTLGWQWTAGCGTDAAPYFRIFNPVLQSKRFDPQGKYLRRWLPELAALPDRWIHQPEAAPSAVLTSANIKLGHDYPLPIVDLKRTRDIALNSYQSIRL